MTLDPRSVDQVGVETTALRTATLAQVVWQVTTTNSLLAEQTHL